MHNETIYFCSNISTFSYINLIVSACSLHHENNLKVYATSVDPYARLIWIYTSRNTVIEDFRKLIMNCSRWNQLA